MLLVYDRSIDDPFGYICFLSKSKLDSVLILPHSQGVLYVPLLERPRYIDLLTFIWLTCMNMSIAPAVCLSFSLMHMQISTPGGEELILSS
jgi:hypothetical protein